VQLNPANNKSILEIQSDRLASDSKGKQKAPTPDDSDGDVLQPGIDFQMQDIESEPEEVASRAVPLSRPESIETLRAKLHAKIDTIRSKKRSDNEGSSRDELLEERRLHRAALRERRRKETKAKIQREKERKGKPKEKTEKPTIPVKVSRTAHIFAFFSSLSEPATRHQWRFVTIAIQLSLPADERGILIDRRVIDVES
jgi:hypothetical protein